MDKFIHILFDYIIEYLVRAIGVLLVTTVLMQIFTRIFFRVPFPWTDELARFTFIWYCFLGSVLTMYRKMHLGIDYFESKMKIRHQYANRTFVYAVQIVFSLLLAYYGFKLLGIVGLQKSPIMRLHIKYIYLALPVSGILYLILSVHELACHLRNKEGVLTSMAQAGRTGQGAK
ncbi:MAG: TRAP transporter small permease [Sphaerochaetaceae bacterium]|nr:TRAP transporter small permease [Sphaerochaetaceae bacterium]